MMVLLCLLFFGLCLGFLACEDIRRFEIRYEVLPLLSGIWLYLGGQMGLETTPMLLGALLWGGLTAVAYRVRPGAVGQGDIWLLAAFGLVVGLNDLALGAGLLAASSVVTSVAYGLRRKRKRLYSMFPLAVPVSASLLLLTLGRLLNAGEAAAQPLLGTVMDWAVLGPICVLLSGMLLGWRACEFTLKQEARK